MIITKSNDGELTDFAIGSQRATYEALLFAQSRTEETAAEATLDKARAGLDSESFERAWDEGTDMSGVEAFDYALDNSS